MKNRVKQSVLLAALAAAWAPGAALAAVAQTWTLVDANCTLNCSSSNTYREYRSNEGGTLKVQALYTTGSSLNNNLQRRQSGSSAVISSQDPNGIGLTNPVSGDRENYSPDHAIDNIKNRDFVLLDFGQLMDLSSFSIGWKGGDSDMSFLFAPETWDMSSMPLYNPTTGQSNGTSINDLIASQWSRQNFDNVGLNSSVSFASGTRSRYALVSGALGSTNDAFKFKTITATAVPIPGTLALVGLGLGVLGWTRRSANKGA